MIIRRHAKGETQSEAHYSSNGAYRYRLDRRWGGGRAVLFVMLNPSTATELANDPTIERCERRARMWGHGALSVVNLFAYRATRPRDLMRAADPVGPDNDAQILTAAQEAGLILCAWGVHGVFQGRDKSVEHLLRDQGLALHALAWTAGGTPRHPLYLPYVQGPQAWPGEMCKASGTPRA